MMKRMGISLLLLIAACAVLGATGQTYQETLRPSDDGEIIVRSDAPQVTIERHSDSQDVLVDLSGPGKDRYRLTVRKDGGDVFVEVKKKRGVFIGLRSFLDARLTVSIPRQWEGSVLSVSTVSGALQVKEPVSGRSVYLKSVSGAINFDTIRTTREASVETVSGAIRGHLVEAGELDLSSVSGAIQVDSITETGNGKALVETVSGSIRIGRTEGDSFKLGSVSGAIQVALPARFAGVVTTSSISGSTSADFASEHTASSDKRTQRHTVGSGTDSMEVGTTSGSIRITR